jgi:hypothetical protein
VTEVILDGCCGQGGGARGYAEAGHYVIGVDSDPGCREGYLCSGADEFICADILDALANSSFMSQFTVALVNPPCQGYSGMSHCRPEIEGRYPRLIHLVRPLLEAWGGPYVIENVEGAREAMRAPVTMCMWMFGRETYRHRLLEAGGGLVLHPPRPEGWSWVPPHGCVPARRIRVNARCGWPHPVPTERAGHWKPGCGKFVSVAGHERKEPVREVMEISENWMPDREAVAEAIPWYLGWWVIGQVTSWREARSREAGPAMVP